jgi:hypothetical protein
LVTEVVLKTGTLQKFRSEYDILVNAGVTCSPEEFVAATHFRQLLSPLMLIIIKTFMLRAHLPGYSMRFLQMPHQ